MSETTDYSGPVLIDGATGYVGSHLTAYLLENGISVRCLVHSGASDACVEFLGNLGARVFKADLALKNKADLEDAFSGVKTAVHLIGSIAPRKGENLEYLHVNQTDVLVEQARASRVKKIVMVTAAGSRPDAPSNYHLTKWQAETRVTGSGLDFVILRPSLIAGRTTGNRNSKLVDRYAHLIATRPFIPLLNGGRNLVQPIFIGDLVQALYRVIATEEFNGQTLDVGGPDVLSMKEFVSILMETQSVQKSYLELPQAVARVCALICEAIQDRPLVSRDQVILSAEDNVVSGNSLESILGVKPTSVRESLRSYRTAIAERQAKCGGRI